MMKPNCRPLALALVLASSASAESLLLPVPGTTEGSREKINLAITIPAKSTPRPEEPARERVKSSALSGYDFQPFKTIPQKKFVFETLKIMRRKGMVRYIFDQTLIDDEQDGLNEVAICVQRVYAKLLDVYRKDALKKFGIVTTDIERFQRLVDIFAAIFERDGYPVAEVNRNLDAMIDQLKKTTGRGQIRITGLREQKDGSTLVEMEILRGPQYNR